MYSARFLSLSLSLSISTNDLDGLFAFLSLFFHFVSHEAGVLFCAVWFRARPFLSEA